MGQSAGKAMITYINEQDMNKAINSIHIRGTFGGKVISMRKFTKDKHKKPTVEDDPRLLRRLTLYNLTYKASIEDIKNTITEFGKIEEILIPRNREGYPQGYAFVFMHSEEDCQRVMDFADERHILGRQVRIMRYEKLTSKQERVLKKGSHSFLRPHQYE